MDKVYRAQVAGIMTQEDVVRFKEGIELKDFTTLPAELEMLEVDRETDSCLVQIRIAEGKFHQVKRMVAACGKRKASNLRKQEASFYLCQKNVCYGQKIYKFACTIKANQL